MGERECVPVPEPSDETWELVRTNLPLVPRIAARFRGPRASSDDLRAEGVLGLVEAALRYDPSLGVRFTTYASFWVQKRMREAILNETWFVQVSKYQLDRLSRIRAAERELRGELGRAPVAEEIAERSGLGVPSVRVALAGVPRRAALDDPVSPGRSRRLEDTLAQSTVPGPLESAEKASALRFLHARLESLPARERAVLRMHFGLDGREPRPLAAIAERYGLSRERIHQIERTALRRLRRLLDHPSGPAA